MGWADDLSQRGEDCRDEKNADHQARQCTEPAGSACGHIGLFVEKADRRQMAIHGLWRVHLVEAEGIERCGHDRIVA